MFRTSVDFANQAHPGEAASNKQSNVRQPEATAKNPPEIEAKLKVPIFLKSANSVENIESSNEAESDYIDTADNIVTTSYNPNPAMWKKHVVNINLHLTTKSNENHSLWWLIYSVIIMYN